MIEQINENSTPLQRTPSARRDLADAAQAQRAGGVDPTGGDVFYTLSIEQHAARSQRLRKQLHLIDAEIAECNADLARAELLHGAATTTTRYTVQILPNSRHPARTHSDILMETVCLDDQCDADCIVNGCGEQFALHQGVHCDDCKLFLCFPCVRTYNLLFRES